MPPSIKRFETLTFISLLIGVINLIFSYDQVTRAVNAVALLLIFGITLVVLMSLVLLISRKRSRVAKWIFVVVWLIGFLPTIPTLADQLKSGLPGLLGIATLVFQVIGMYYLFDRSSSDYLKAKAA